MQAAVDVVAGLFVDALLEDDRVSFFFTRAYVSLLHCHSSCISPLFTGDVLSVLHRNLASLSTL